MMAKMRVKHFQITLHIEICECATRGGECERNNRCKKRTLTLNQC